MGKDNKGQHWTPQWLAEPMVRYALKDWAGTPNILFDPAAGNGAFQEALCNIDDSIQFKGIEIDPQYVDEEKGIEHGNFFEHLFFLNKYWSMAVNPPFVRNHHIPVEEKVLLQKFCKKVTGLSIDGRSGLHFYFFIKCLMHLEHGGRMAFIMPADLFEGVSSREVWEWVASHYRIDAVIGFESKVSPFPNLDVNVFVAFISASLPSNTVRWEVVDSKKRLDNLVSTDFALAGIRDLGEAIQTGLSRPEMLETPAGFFGEYAHVMRGIATGANEFFFLTRQQITDLGLESGLDLGYFKRAIGKVRHAEDGVIYKNWADDMDKKDVPTYLLSLDGTEKLPPEFQDYIKKGEEQGFHKRSLIKQRNPWYKMEQRSPPPFLFCYLGRRKSRFLKNYAKVLPLTSFLCIYPTEGKVKLRNVWKVLQDERFLNRLSLVAKSYGGDSIKVEPKSLKQLPLSEEIVEMLKKD